MKRPLVSVVMATYNHANFVKQAIESVLAQQEVDFEFLIGDDGSSDLTREVIASVSDQRISFFPSLINRGVCIVTNELINRASGEFIALINSDDYWLNENKLASQIQIMREKPGVGACFSKARFIDAEDQLIDKASLPGLGTLFDQEHNRSQGLWLRRFFEWGNCLCNPTVLIRKTCFDNLGLYNNRYRQTPDFEMWIRLIKRYPIYLEDKETISYRVFPSQNASSPTLENSIRTANEIYLFAEIFFDNVSRELLMEGFSDCLIIKDIPTQEHLDIEKTLLYFQDNQWMPKAYKLTGLRKMSQLLNSQIHHELLVNAYGITDLWFQKQMGSIDYLRGSLDLETQFSNLRHTIVVREAEIVALEAHNVNLNQIIAAKNDQIRGCLDSLSWRITKPFRLMYRQAQKVNKLTRNSRK